MIFQGGALSTLSFPRFVAGEFFVTATWDRRSQRVGIHLRDLNREQPAQPKTNSELGLRNQDKTVLHVSPDRKLAGFPRGALAAESLKGSDETKLVFPGDQYSLERPGPKAQAVGGQFPERAGA